MGNRDKKTGKGRLDKYYRLAKEQGYRARSAFKLIQLDKKYNFLSSARCVIDLCAAPGGWLQVASKYMPPSNSMIVGVDLAPIKPIPRVVTFQEDITTPICRDKIRAEIKDWKADVVLHDGAPNVGTAWIQDAFTQAELVLSSLKLATEFLAPGGLFITKIFRSKDYNSLLWVFSQLFNKVEATKPPSSRNVSAEIFVVCMGYKAPRKIDPKLLDPGHVFKDLEPVAAPFTEGPSTGKKLTQQATNIFHPEKKRRKREGYEEGEYTQFKLRPVEEFITGRNDPIAILSETSRFDFTSEQGQKFYANKHTTEDIKACALDLKVLGKKDFKNLLKWRLALREQLGLERKAVVEAPQEVAEVTPLEAAENEDLEIEEELDRITTEAGRAQRKERRRKNERKAREVLKMQLGMTTPMDLGLDAGAGGLGEMFDLKEVDAHGKAKVKLRVPVPDGAEESSADEGAEEDSEAETEFSDEEDARIHGLEATMDNLYDEYQNRLLERDAKAKVRQMKQKKRMAEGGEFTGIGSDEEASDDDEEEEDEELDQAMRAKPEDSDSDSSASEDEAPAVGQKRSRGGHLITKLQDDATKARLATDKERKAALWYDQAVFKNVPGLEDLLQVSDGDDDDGSAEEAESDSEEEKTAFEPDEVIEWSSDDEEADRRSDSVEEVPLTDFQAKEDAQAIRIERFGLDTAEAITLATQLVNREKSKSDLMDDGFHRYAFDDKDNAPSWFLDDEMKHFRQNVPVTKEAVQILRSRMRALDARPIKKVAEAKARKKMRANRRLDRLTKSADYINENPDMSEKEKSSSIAKLVAKASRNPTKAKKDMTKVVVARGINKGNVGRPKGVKGRYKMVDSRMKKEVRAAKRVARAAKGKGKSKKGK